MHSLKKLWPSFALVAIYFITDEFLGPVTSAICILFLGFCEFFYNRWKERTYEWLTLLTALFFSIPGLLSLCFENSVMLRFQPGIQESGLCILLGILAFSRTDLTATLPASYRKTLTITPQQQKMMKNTVRILFYIFCAHTLVVFFSLFYLDKDTTSFISGTLLYILIGLFFGALFIRNQLILRKQRQEEWLPVVNEKGEVRGRAPRSVCHSGSKLLHPVVHLHILNQKQEIFLQKRSMKKDLLPGKWDTAVGGHVGMNEKIEDALKREAFEELGITNFEAHFNGSYVWESPREKELVFSFLCLHYDHIRIDNDEVDEGRFWSEKEIETAINENLLTPNFVHEYQTILKNMSKR